MVKLVFPENTTKMEYDEFYELYEKKLSEISPALYEKSKNEGSLSVMGLARHIVFPKSENKFDRHFFDFFLLSLKDGTTVWLPPNLKDLRYYDYRDYLVGTEIYTPKGSVSERFFKSYTFPKSVKNGFPIIDGERIIPNDTTMIWFDADGTKRIIKESEKHSSFRTILYALVGFSIAVVLFGLLAHFIK